MAFAFVFPGQGSQSVGMLAGLAAAEPQVSSDLRGGLAGARLRSVAARERGAGGCPERHRAHAAGDAHRGGRHLAAVARARRGAPAPSRGHSLGEFTALVCAEALEFPAAVELVRFRGELMQAGGARRQRGDGRDPGPGGCAVEAACAEAAQGAIVEPANFNSPGQVVIAGDAAAVARAIEAAQARGAKRAVLLPVSVPAHSSLMRAAAQRLAAAAARLDLARPQIRYVSAVDAAAHAGTGGHSCAARCASSQAPCAGRDTLRAVSAAPIAQVIECGPGKVLTGLNRRIEKRDGLSFLALEDPAVAAGGARGDAGMTPMLKTKSRSSPGPRAASVMPSRWRLGGAGARVIGTATTPEGRGEVRRGARSPRIQRPRRGPRCGRSGLDRCPDGGAGNGRASARRSSSTTRPSRATRCSCA